MLRLEKRCQRLLRQEQEKKKKGKEKSKEDMADYEIGGPETDESDQVRYRCCGSNKS